MKSALKQVYKRIPLKKHFYLLIRSFWQPPRSVSQYFLFWDKFKIRVKDNYFFMKQNGLFMENDLFWNGLENTKFEKLSIRLWIELCTDAQYIMDIGANSGIYALIAKALNPQAKVYAFEPIPRTFDKLTENVHINNFDIICEKVAVSDTDGESIIFDPETEFSHLATLNPTVAEKNKLGKKTPVKLQKLSSYIRKHNIPRIDLMKVDVEGNEPNVLLGMENFLDSMRPTLLLEINSDEMGKQIEAILQDKDYLYFNIDEKDRIDQVYHLTQSYQNNFLICSEEMARKISLIP